MLHFFSFTSDRLERYVETKSKHFKESSFIKMISFFLSSVLTAFFFKNSLFHQFRMVQEGSNASSLLFSQPKHRTPISLRKQNSYRSAIASLLSFRFSSLRFKASSWWPSKPQVQLNDFPYVQELAFSHSFVVSSDYHKFSLTRLCLLQLTYHHRQSFRFLSTHARDCKLCQCGLVWREFTECEKRIYRVRNLLAKFRKWKSSQQPGVVNCRKNNFCLHYIQTNPSS